MAEPAPAPAVRFVLDPAFAVGAVDPRLFGSFVEHLGRCVYTGIYEPGHPEADADGLRTDVLELIRELGVTVLRYPGGNFVSGYKWEDGVGPLERRPRRLDPAWHSIETNAFGLGEFMAALEKIPGSEPMLAVNLGTRGVSEALELLEYANHPGGTELSDRRVAAGHAKPYGIKLWCLGNEMDGPWQIGHKSAEEYGALAAAGAWAMRLVDPAVKLVACGSSSRAMPTFGQWEATVLEHCYDLVDYVSMHAYYEETDADRDSFLASAVDMEAFIEGVVATCDYAGARRKSEKKLMLSFDEWNVWYIGRGESEPAGEWREAPRLLEDVYSVTDAVVVGSLIIALLRHADRVAVACLAQLVNVIAPIMTEPGGPAWRQTTFFPFAQAAACARTGGARVLTVNVQSPTHHTRKHGEAQLLHATAVTDEAGAVTIFAVNRSQTEALPLEVELRGLSLNRVVEHSVLADADPDAKNTLQEPERIAPRARGDDARRVRGQAEGHTAAALVERHPAHLAGLINSGIVAAHPRRAAQPAPSPPTAHRKLTSMTSSARPIPPRHARPPMGWNSWDCYGTTVTEDEVLANAAFMHEHLASHGWDTVVVDIQWYEPTARAHGYNPNAPLVLDGFGRQMPAPNRFPSAAAGAGFGPLAGRLHELGLRFGLHIMRGVPRRAVAERLPVAGTSFTADQIADTGSVCPWNPDNYGLNHGHPGAQAYYDAQVAQFARWGVDFIKADDMLAPYHDREISAYARAIARSGRPIELSLSPGTDLSLAHLDHLGESATMWRVCDDLWDRWEHVAAQFARMARWAPWQGVRGWADADMLPLGRIGIRAERGEDRLCELTRPEQISLMTLWLISRSPLMMGGDLPTSPPQTIELLTNDEALSVLWHSIDNREVLREEDLVLWTARDTDGSTRYAAVFSLAPDERRIQVPLGSIGARDDEQITELWTHSDVPHDGRCLLVDLPAHGAALYRLTPTPDRAFEPVMS